MYSFLKMYKANIRIFLQKIPGFYNIMCIYILALKLGDIRSNMIRNALDMNTDYCIIRIISQMSPPELIDSFHYLLEFRKQGLI